MTSRCYVSHECNAQNRTLRKFKNEEQEPTVSSLDINPKRVLGWLQTIDNPKASRKMLEMFREHLPEAHLLITSFAGKGMVPMAKDFNGSFDYIHDDKGLFPKRKRKASVSIPFFLKTLYLVCLRYEDEADWLLNLEDDVEIFNTPKRAEENCSLCGPGKEDKAPRWRPPLNVYLKKTAGRRHWNRYSGCGGSILNIKDYISAYQKLDVSAWSEYEKLDPRLNRSCDASISFVLQNAGFGVCKWKEYTGFRNKDKRNYAVAHGNKEFYDPLVSPDAPRK